MNRFIGIASAILLVGVLAACTATDPRLEDEPLSPGPVQTSVNGNPVAPATAPSARGERVVILSGANVTLPADQSVELLLIYNSTARVEGHASTVMVVNGAANFVGARANDVIAIQSQVALDDASRVSGDIRGIDSSVSGATAATVSGRVRDFGPDMLFGWRGLGTALLLAYIAFAVSALIAGVILAGLAGRQLRAASALIVNEPLMVVGAGIVGLIALLTAGIIAIVTIVGIPFGIGLLALVMPGLFVIGYIVVGVGIGDWILGRTSPVVRERPYLAAVVGLTVVGLVSFLPPVSGLISFVGFGSVMLLSWRVLRGIPGTVPAATGIGRIAESAS